MDKRIPGIVRILLIGVIIAVTGLLLWDKLQLGIHRYFDADELAYLHWGHNAYAGRIPYKDFLAYIPPAFYYVVSVFYFFTDTAEILLIGRIFSFAVFCGITLSLIYIFWQVRRNVIAALVAGTLLAFIPIPADKFIEIRPDNLAMLMALVATICHITALSGRGTKRHWIAAGIFYGLSLFILPKSLPQVMVAGLVTLLWGWLSSETLRVRMSGVRSFIVGIGLPAGVFCGWLLITMRSPDELMLAWYSLTRLPFEAQRISALFPLQPDLYFYPNDLLYGASGWNRALMVNHVLWFLGLSLGSIRLVTPFVPNGRNGAWSEVLIAGAFFGYIISFFYGYPMRHEQYLIPIAIFTMFYAADAIGVLWEYVRRRPMGMLLGTVTAVLLLLAMLGVSRGMNTTKLRYTNSYDYTLLRFALQEIPRDAYVFDLIGSTIYFSDPYYVSAVPFGQWEPYLSRPLPRLPQSLEVHNTQYVYEGGLGRISNLSPESRSYISGVFRPVGGMPGLYRRGSR